MAYSKTEQAIEYKPNPWEVKRKDVDVMLRKYRDAFVDSVLFLDAMAERWDYLLFQYAMCVAKVQAQIITQSKIGYNSMILFSGDDLVKNNFVNNWLDEQRVACAEGFISVAIPHDKIEFFKRCRLPK